MQVRSRFICSFCVKNDVVYKFLFIRISRHIRFRNYISADYLEGWLRTAYVYTAMTDYPTPSNFLNPMPAYPVKQVKETKFHSLLHRRVFWYFPTHDRKQRGCFGGADV